MGVPPLGPSVTVVTFVSVVNVVTFLPFVTVIPVGSQQVSQSAGHSFRQSDSQPLSHSEWQTTEQGSFVNHLNECVLKVDPNQIFLFANDIMTTNNFYWKLSVPFLSQGIPQACISGRSVLQRWSNEYNCNKNQKLKMYHTYSNEYNLYN